MAPTTTPDPSAPGASIRTARRARVRMIRRRVVGGALALFVAVWMLLAVTLISGHDTALAKRSGSATGSSNGSGTTATVTTSGDSTSSSTGLSPVTTSQS